MRPRRRVRRQLPQPSVGVSENENGVAFREATSGMDAKKRIPRDSALEGDDVTLPDTKTNKVRVIVNVSSNVVDLCKGRSSFETHASPDVTVTSESEVEDEMDALEVIPRPASVRDSPSEVEIFEESLLLVSSRAHRSDYNQEECSEIIQPPQSLEKEDPQTPYCSFLTFRMNYLLVMTAIMLADGLQGTHLYVLYEGYGYSVASLYCLGFLTGAITSPITGPLVDRFGRKNSAMAYCILEIAINQLEQYPYLPGLIVSRMVGGVTTNLLSSVFETWLDTEYRRRGFNKKDYEIVMRDSVVISNLAAIGSGYLAHVLAETFGPKGPFKGAVTCTAIALGVVTVMWTENYGSREPGMKTTCGYLRDAIATFKSDSRVLRVGLIQGLTTGSIQIFIFLWSPSLRLFAKNSPLEALGLDDQGEPAYGLIFGAFMACGVIGGLIAPLIRKAATLLLSPLSRLKDDMVEVEGEGVRPMAVEFVAASCYFASSLLLLTPCLVSSDGVSSFSLCLTAFLLYELVVGIYLPNAGVIRSIYLPSDSRCSLLTMPQVIVNVAVSLGVASTNVISLQTAFAAVSCLMMTAAILQLTLVSSKEWSSLFGRVDHVQKSARRISFNTCESIRSSFDDYTIFRLSSSVGIKCEQLCGPCPNSVVPEADENSLSTTAFG